MRRIRTHSRREKTKRENDDPISHRKGIQQDAPNAGDMERAPNQFVGMPALLVDVSRMLDGPWCAPMPEQQRFRQNIGRIQRRHAHRDDGVERDRGPDVDQTDYATHQRHHHDRIQRDRRVVLDRRHRSPEGQTFVPTESEYDPWRCGEEGDRGADVHDDYDADHGRGTGEGVGGGVEDLHEREAQRAGGGCKGGVDVGRDEEDGEEHGEAENAVE